MPVSSKPSSGIAFHSLHATSHALQPMQTDVSVKKPTRGGGSVYPASVAGSIGPYRLLRPIGLVLGGQDRCVLLRCDARPVAVTLHVRQQVRAGGSTPGPDVAGADLALLDQHVRVQSDADQVVRRVAGDQALAAEVVRQPDLVQGATLDAQ